MTAKQLAEKMLADEKKKIAEQAMIEEIEAKQRKTGESKMASLIVKALSSFGKGYQVEKKWFGGSDYWVLSKNGSALMSCVLYYDRGTWDPSDDCRNVPYENWAVLVCPGMWEGPHGRRGTAGISNEHDLNEAVARIMKNYL